MSSNKNWCPDCGGELKREEMVDITEDQVIELTPLFTCSICGKEYYILSDLRT